MINSLTRLKIAPRVSIQELGPEEGGVVLRLESGELYTVNDTTMSFLRQLDGVRTIEEVAGTMLGEFEVSQETLIADLVNIAGELVQESVIISLP